MTVDISKLSLAIQGLIDFLVLLWNGAINNFILSIPIFIAIIYAVLAGIDKLKKMVK